MGHTRPSKLCQLAQRSIDGSLRTRLKFVNRCALLILDNFGIKGHPTPSECELLYEVLDDRILDGRDNGLGATVSRANCPRRAWHGYLCMSNPTTPACIMDRMIANATKIEFQGESLRSDQDVLSD